LAYVATRHRSPLPVSAAESSLNTIPVRSIPSDRPTDDNAFWASGHLIFTTQMVAAHPVIAAMFLHDDTDAADITTATNSAPGRCMDSAEQIDFAPATEIKSP
jgi:hypothetical protein